MRVADDIVAQRRAVRHAVRRRAAGRAALLRRRRGARPRGHQAQDRDQRPALRRGDRGAARPAADPLDPGEPRRRHAGGLRAPARRARRSPRRTPRAARYARPAFRSRSRSRRRALNIHEAEAVIARARELGAFRFNTGKLMRIGTAARLLEQARAERGAVSRVPRRARARRRAFLNRAWNSATFPGASRTGCAPRLVEPPATLLVLPNGWVKVAAALPGICADLRRTTLVAGLAGVSRGLAGRSDTSSALRRAIDDESHTRKRTTGSGCRLSDV